MDTDTRCGACSEVPSGIVGHEELWVESVGNISSVFRCGRCTTRWTRSSTSDGSFRWMRIDEPVSRKFERGVAVPPRTGLALLKK